MRKIVFVVALILIASAAYAVGDQAYLGMFVETSVMKMAGMPAVELPPGMDLSSLGNVPGMESMMSMGAPQRKLQVRLWSPGIAPKDSSAVITPPAGLKQGDKLVLDIYRPEPVKGKSESGGTTDEGNGATDFTIKYYWGSSATVKPGQPKVFRFSSLAGDQKQNMKQMSQKVSEGDYFYKPDWTTAYWPTKKQPGKIAKDAALPGTYSLTTNYCGSVTIDCPQNVNFLDPIDMTSPNLEEQINLEQAVKFVWKPIPNLLGSAALITGMEGKNTLIIWSSSEVWQESMMSVDWGYLQMAEVRKFVEDTIMMAGDRTSATVPAGIFKDCDMANMMMVGYGTGAARDKVQPLPRIQTKTSLMLMLGGKEMAMDGGGNEDDTAGEGNTASEEPAPKSKPKVKLPSIKW